ncbi:MAG: protein kinase domain-containing protein [Gemmatimonadaceae bacterium]
MSDTVAFPTGAQTTRPLSGGSACTRCGATMATLATACPRCGAAVTGDTAAEHAERVRQRLQDAVGERYELLELLGRGGMGIVFRARETALDREVALKVLALDPLLAPEAYERFEREARLAARLDHPGIVPIFSVGQGASVAYYTMRLVRGGSVEELLATQRQLDLARATAILRDVAAALDYAHRQGVVHRDIKPANILLGEEGGHATVADFGIAKALGPTDGASATGTGVIGSPGYMSPEQWRGEPADGRTDQYALGIVAYEMLAGRRPFETVRVQDLLKLHLSAEVPDVCAARPELDPAVGAAIRRALAKFPAERFPSVSAFVETLAGRRPLAAGTAPRAPRLEPATLPLEQPGESAGSGAAIVVLATLLVVAGAVGAASIVPRTRPAVLRGWEVVRSTVGAGTRATAPANRPGPAALPAAPPAIVDSTGVGAEPSADSLAGAADGSPAAAQPPARTAIGLDPALAGSAASAPAPRPAPPFDDAGFLRVITRGGSARVRVDGRGYGFTPLVLRVDPGPHAVTVEGAGDAFLPLQVRVDIASGDTAAAVFTAPGWGRSRPEAAPVGGAPDAPSPAQAPPPAPPRSADSTRGS